MSLRSVIDQLLTLLGTAIAVVPVAAMSESWTPILVVIVGVLMIGAGAWRLSNKLLPDRRVYNGLRSEVRHFIAMIPELNSRAVKGEDLEPLRARMKDSVDRMILAAGKTGPGR